MKRKIRFRFEGDTYIVEAEKKGNAVTVEKDGKVYHIDLIPEKKYEVSIPQPVTKQVVTADPPIQCAVPPAEQEETASGGEGLLLAPMTGVIREIKVSAGQKVSRSQVVIIMEAMKMDIDVQAPVTGVVKEIYVKEGAHVNAKQKLLGIY